MMTYRIASQIEVRFDAWLNLNNWQRDHRTVPMERIPHPVYLAVLVQRALEKLAPKLRYLSG
jgi:hypothetical protein